MNRLWRVTFLPIMGRTPSGGTTEIGRWMCYVTAPDMLGIADVIRAFLPELHDDGYEVQEEIAVSPGHVAWSVSVGMPGKSRSFVVTAADEHLAMRGLETLLAGDDELICYVQNGAFVTRFIDMDKEGVW